MQAMPELANVMILIGIFLGVFIVSKVTARASGYRE